MNKKKIALVGFRLSRGGGDRVMATLSKFFSNEGFNVHIIIFHDEIGFDHSGKLYNLGKLKSKNNSVFNKIKRFIHFNKYIKKQEFDVIIDFRFRISTLQELLISRWIYKQKTIYTIHSSKLDTYIPKNKFLANLIYSKSYKIVCVANAIKTLVNENYNFANVEFIHNPIDLEEIAKKTPEKIDVDFKYILAVGRYDTNVKQFDKLIKMYSQSILPEKQICLVIMGSGKLEEDLKQVSRDVKVENSVKFIGFKDNPYAYMAKAKFLALTSKHEGLPMVILETLASGTPVISFNCRTGPSEIITNKHNGILVQHQDETDFIKAMNVLIENEELYARCKGNAKNSVSDFSVDRIGKKWLHLLNNDE